MSKPIATYSRTKEIMDKHKLSFKKSLGQNFLIDSNILKKIVDKAGVTDDTTVIEIGPGIGALTEQLALKAKEVFAIEIDQRFIGVLNDTLQGFQNIQVMNEDILKVDLNAFIAEKMPEASDVRVVANLPYYITTPILMKLLMENSPIHSITVMMQKEVAARMAAKPNSKEYGSLSIAVQYYTTSNVVMTVPKTCFIPQPNVDSAILQLVKRDRPPVEVTDEELFFEVVQKSFQQRRKTLKNNLQKGFQDRVSKEQLQNVFNQAAIEPSRRGESLSMEEFSTLTKFMKEALEV